MVSDMVNTTLNSIHCWTIGNLLILDSELSLKPMLCRIAPIGVLACDALRSKSRYAALDPQQFLMKLGERYSYVEYSYKKFILSLQVGLPSVYA